MTLRKSGSRKRLEGTARADRALKVAGGERFTVTPRPPGGMSAEATRHWRSLARAFTSAGTLTPADLSMLRLLAEALADEADCRRLIAAEGSTIPGADGAVKLHPAIRRGEVARALAVRLLGEFGGSPAARQRVEAAPIPASSDPAESFLRVVHLQRRT